MARRQHRYAFSRGAYYLYYLIAAMASVEKSGLFLSLAFLSAKYYDDSIYFFRLFRLLKYLSIHTRLFYYYIYYIIYILSSII